MSYAVICSFGWRVWLGPFQPSLCTWNGSFRVLCFSGQKQTLLSLYPGQKGLVCLSYKKTSWLQVSAWKKGAVKVSESELGCWVDRGGENTTQPGVVGWQLATGCLTPSFLGLWSSQYVCRGMPGWWCDECSQCERPPDAPRMCFSNLLVYFHVWFKVCCSKAGVCPPYLVTLW